MMNSDGTDDTILPGNDDQPMKYPDEGPSSQVTTHTYVLQHGLVDPSHGNLHRVLVIEESVPW